MKKVKVGCLSFIVIFIIALVIGTINVINNPEKYQKDEQKKDVQVLANASDFSRISVEELISMMGEPSSIENWTNETTKGDFSMQIYSYDQTNHYEFFIADDKVVELHLYSEKSWTNEGSLFQYDSNNIFAMLDIEPSDDLKKIADTGFTLKYSPVSNTVAEITIENIDRSNNTFDSVKIIYNLNYFD